MHTPTIALINSYASDALKQKNPLLFLQRLGPLHHRWHQTSVRRRTVGFLLFHWHLIVALKHCHSDKLWPGGVVPFTLANWSAFSWPYSVPDNVASGDFDSLAAFSHDIEIWHGEAHHAVMMATGEDLMTTTTNVLLRDFWRLHYFINARFLEALAAYDSAGTVTKKISKLEKQHEGQLGEI
jgi:hypothetical protein